MKTYLITGGAGFIGSHVVDSLIDDNKVIVIDNFNTFYDPKLKWKNIEKHLKHENYKLEQVDIRNGEEINRIFLENKIDIIIHLAAMAGVRPSIENPILYQEVNCIGSQNIFEAAKNTNVKNIVFASSSSVYGNNKKVPFKETDIVDNAISPYAATKKANEVMGHVYHSLYNINLAFLRFFTVYGPRQRPDLAINKFVRNILNDEPIPVYGDGTTYRDYTYIGDIVNGILKTVKWLENQENAYEIFNLGRSEPITLNEMIENIEKALNKKAIIDRKPMQLGDVDMTYADVNKAKEIIGYNPTTSFFDGVSKFIEWHKDMKLEEK